MPDAADILVLNVDDQEAPRYAKTRPLRHTGPNAFADAFAGWSRSGPLVPASAGEGTTIR
jgi:hypothetical protein